VDVEKLLVDDVAAMVRRAAGAAATRGHWWQRQHQQCPFGIGVSEGIAWGG
jgi:hypothetical protein